MTNTEKFREVYTRRLTASVIKNPTEFFYGVDGVPAVVEKMIVALAKGEANVHSSYAIKSTCKELGFSATIKGIKAYLNS